MTSSKNNAVNTGKASVTQKGDEALFNIIGDKSVNLNPKGLLEASPVFKPFRYPWAYNAYLRQQRLHWLPEEAPMDEDVKQFNDPNILKPAEKNLVTKIFQFFTQADCFPLNTQILTENGWEELGKLSGNTRVAQVSVQGRLSFAKPLVSAREHTHPAKDGLVRIIINGGDIDMVMTPGHNLYVRRNHETIKIKARDFHDQVRVNDVFLATAVAGDETRPVFLTPLEKLLVAFQETGERFVDNRTGRAVVTFHVSGEAARKNLHRVIADNGLVVESFMTEDDEEETFVVREDDNRGDLGRNVFSVLSHPEAHRPAIDSITTSWARSYLAEWCLYVPDDKSIGAVGVSAYVDRGLAEWLHIVACISGRKGRMSILGTEGAETYIISVAPLSFIPVHHVDVETINSNEPVSCVTVPEGNIIINSGGMPVVIGNCEVCNAYNSIYIPIFKPNEVRMMLSCFANIETIHQVAYSHLLDTVGIPESDYTAFLSYKQMRDKFDAMHDYVIHTKADAARSVAVFSGFMEGLQLFASFAILLNFPRRGLMKGMGQIVAWSVRDETIHVESMCKLFRVFIAENPEIWTEEFRESIRDACRMCVHHEDEFIKLAYEQGDVEGLPAEEVQRYIRFIANRRLGQLGIEGIYDIKKNPLPWIDDMLSAPEHANFFENRATEYSRAATTGSWEDAFVAASDARRNMLMGLDDYLPEPDETK